MCVVIDKLREGDELLEVNGIPVAGMRTEDIIHLMVRVCVCVCVCVCVGVRIV